MPPPNLERRRVITDAAIEVTAEVGLRSLTHRAVDRWAGLPTGTTANYFPTRDALLVATANRIMELHREDLKEATATQQASSRGELSGSGETVVGLLASSLFEATTTHRPRYMAIFELRAEARLRPSLAAAMEELGAVMARSSIEHHRARSLPIRPDVVPGLMAMYGGALLALLSVPRADVTDAAARSLAEVIVYGAMGRPPNS